MRWNERKDKVRHLNSWEVVDSFKCHFKPIVTLVPPPLFWGRVPESGSNCQTHITLNRQKKKKKKGNSLLKYSGGKYP